MEFTKVGTEAFLALGIGAALAFLLPLAIAVVWKVGKKERFTTILAGAVVFVLFALILEKPIQNVLLFPTQMLLPEHAVSRFFAERPLLLALAAGLFPGVFEETGRLIAYKTVLKERKNRESAISYGIGHGGAEVMVLLGVTYVAYLAYAVMINTGTFGTLMEQAAAAAPDQAAELSMLAGQLAGVTAADIALGLLERAFAFLFHVGASILVFYACRDKKRFRLYPLAVLLHTALDFVSALYLFGIGGLSVWTVEIAAAVIGLLTFAGAYCLLYRKDKAAGRDLS